MIVGDFIRYAEMRRYEFRAGLPFVNDGRATAVCYEVKSRDYGDQ